MSFNNRFPSLVTVPVHEGGGSFQIEVLDCRDCGATHFSDSVVEYRSHEYQNYLDIMDATYDSPFCGKCMTRGRNEADEMMAGPYIHWTGELRYESIRYYD